MFCGIDYINVILDFIIFYGFANLSYPYRQFLISIF